MWKNAIGDILIPHLNKLERKIIPSILLRYSELSKGYVLVHEDVNNRLIEKESRDVYFFEFQYLEKKKTRMSIELFEMDNFSYQREPTPLAGLSGRDPMESRASGSDYDAFRRSCRG